MKHNPVAFDENAIGQGLTLSVGDTILQTSVAVDGHRMARSRYGNSIKNSTVEFYIYSPNAIVSFPVTGSSGIPDLVVGLVNASASLSKYVGEDADGWSYCPSDGHVRNNGATIAIFATATFNDYIGITFDYVNQAMIVSKNGTVIGEVDLPSESFGPIPYFYAATVSGNPGDLAVYANAGQTPLRYPNGAGGWFHLNIGLQPLYLATEPYITAPTDPVPNQKYQMAIDGSSLSVSRGVRFWVWGSSAPGQLQTGGQVSLSINDPDEVFGELTSLDIRDQEVIIDSVFQGAAFLTANPVLKAIIDHCDQPTDQTKTLVCNDKIVLLQSQLVRPLFAPNADPSVAGKPYPYAGGIVRTHSGAMFDPVNIYIQLTCNPIAAFGKNRDEGVELGYGIDVLIRPDLESISRPTPPNGKTTFETTSYGGTFDATATDALNGDGDFSSDTGYGGGKISTSGTSLVTAGFVSRTFTTQVSRPFHVGNFARATSRGTGEYMQGNITAYNPGSGSLTINITASSGTGTHADWDITGGVNQPTNWVGNGHYFPPDEPKDQVWQLTGSSPHKTLIQPQKADAIYRMLYGPAAPFFVQPGESYAYEVGVVTAPLWGDSGFVDDQGAPVSVLPAELAFGGIDSSTLVMFYWTRFRIPTAGAYRGTFTNTNSFALPLVFGNFCNNVIVPPAVSFLELSGIKMVKLPDLLQNVVLNGPGLTLMLRDLLVTHGPMDQADIDESSSDAIDADTGYVYGLHVSENETSSVIDAARKVLASACADIYVGRDGMVRTVRLFAPEDIDPLPDSSGQPGLSGSITVTDISGYLTPYPDNAEGLSTRIAGCPQPDPYTESDFANVTQSDVPQQVRNLLQQNFQWTKTANAVLATKYQYAENVKPLESQLDREDHGQAEITRVCKLYEKQRWFYVATLFTAATAFDIGQTWLVTYAPIERLANGLQLAVFAVTDHSDGTSTVTFWG